ncbi:MAG: hypothetical protein ACYCO3_10250 [Mycobacteriales bacterium]
MPRPGCYPVTGTLLPTTWTAATNKGYPPPVTGVIGAALLAKAAGRGHRWIAGHL